MLREVKEFVKTCEICQRFNKRTTLAPGEMQEVARAKYPFQCVGLDFAGPFHTTKRKNKHFLVAVDYFSNFIILRACKRQSGEEVRNFLYDEFIVKTGGLERIVCDRGSAFVCEETKQFCDTNNIQIVRLSSYHPKGNSKSERAIQTVKAMLAKILADQEERRKWDELLAEIAFCVNTSIHATLRETPFSIIYGFQPVLKEQRFKGIDSGEPAGSLPHRIIENNYRKNQLRAKKYYDLRHASDKYKRGDLVLILDMRAPRGATRKLLPKFSRPCTVVKQIAPTTYIVDRGPKVHPKLEQVNIARMKRFYARKDDDQEEWETASDGE